MDHLAISIREKLQGEISRVTSLSGKRYWTHLSRKACQKYPLQLLVPADDGDGVASLTSAYFSCISSLLFSNLFGIDVLRRDVISVFILINSCVMRIGILLTRMFCFTDTT